MTIRNASAFSSWGLLESLTPVYSLRVAVSAPLAMTLAPFRVRVLFRNLQLSPRGSRPESRYELPYVLLRVAGIFQDESPTTTISVNCFRNCKGNPRTTSARPASPGSHLIARWHRSLRVKSRRSSTAVLSWIGSRAPVLQLGQRSKLLWMPSSLRSLVGMLRAGH